jgi:hypothetical protein
MRWFRGTPRLLAAGVVGFALGGLLTLSLQSAGQTRATTGGGGGQPEPRPAATAAISTTPEPPETFLAWTPGGLPHGFRQAVRTLPGIERSVVVASGLAWMTRSFSADGTQVDAPPHGLAIPIEVAAVDPSEYTPFLPPSDRGVILALADGDGVMGQMSADVRGFGTGGQFDFGPTAISVAAVLPDELVGANELVVSRRVAATLGISENRYALVQPRPGMTEDELTAEIRTIIPKDLPLRVRAPGETPYFRQGDAVLAPVRIKQLFGEFAARPLPGGQLAIDPVWESRHIATESVPILGDVHCNRALFPQLRGALREVVRSGLAHLIKPNEYGGCFGPRFANRDPTQGISHHAWGIAIDLDVAENLYGHTPTMDPRIVAIFRRWGFTWGGDFLIPDGMHFEFARFVHP